MALGKLGIPSTGQVVSAAMNAAQLLVSGGLADLRPMPRTLVYQGPRRRLYRYDRPTGTAERGDPVLLVASLAAPARGYDLRRGVSLVEHLVGRGRPTYVVEYGDVSLKDRSLGLEDWVDELLPATVRAASEHAGGRPVHLVGWSLGGLFALLVAADGSGLPIASVTSLGAPVDVLEVPLLAPAKPLLDLTQGQGLLARVLRTVTATPTLRWAIELSSVQRLFTDPLAIGMGLDDSDFLAQVEAVGHFQAGMTAYRGRSYGQLYHRFVKNNALVTGTIDLDGRTVALADIEVPVLVVGGTTDGIAPLPAVRAVLPLLSGSREVRFEIVPGGHLGLLTGRGARDSTWAALDGWIDEWSGSDARATRSPARKAPAKKTPATGAKTRTPTEQPSAQDAPTPEEIGTNPQRRYGSAGSRSLSRRP